MAKRTAKIDAEVLACATVGMTVRDIAKKFNISATTISKILKEKRSEQKLNKGKEIIQEVEQNEQRSNQKKAHSIINTIFDSLEKDIKTASVKDKRETLKTLVELFGLPEDVEAEVSGITITVEDASGKEEDAATN